MRLRRESARVLLVYERDRVLLFSGIDRTKPELAPWWFSVGGGLDPGETAHEAAIRETREETGLIITDPGPVVFTRRFCWEFEGQPYDQTESFFVVRTTSFDPSPLGWTELEHAAIRGFRWWSLAELRSTREQYFPENLPDVLERLING